MGQVLDVRVILRPRDVPPCAPGHKVIGVLNPAAAEVDGETRLLVRVIEAFEENAAYDRYFTHGSPPPEFVYLPRAGKGRVDWEKHRVGLDVEPNDRYSVILPGLNQVVRPTVISHARLAALHREGSCGVPSVRPVGLQGFYPEAGYEEFGVEDLRVTTCSSPWNVGGTDFRYVLSYVACSSISGVATALAASNDLESFYRLPLGHPGVVFHPPQKDVVIFPERIHSLETGEDEYWALVRPGAAHRYIAPSMFLVNSPNLIHWGCPHPIISGTAKGHVGAGAPPIRTEHGWLVIYHTRSHLDGYPQYTGWAALLDCREPWRCVRRSREPILLPIQTGEEEVISRVAFPSGAVILDDGTLEVYLGLNDTVVAIARAPLKDVLAAVAG